LRHKAGLHGTGVVLSGLPDRGHRLEGSPVDWGQVDAFCNLMDGLMSFTPLDEEAGGGLDATEMDERVRRRYKAVSGGPRGHCE
jgi:hypothetical protein